MGENTRYIHIFQSKTFPRKPYSGIGIPYLSSRSPRRFPCSSSVSASPRFVMPCRWGGKIASMIKQPIVLTIMRPIVPSISCRLPCRSSRRFPVPFVSSVHLVAVPSSHQLVSCRRSVISPHQTRPVPLPDIPTSWAGRDVVIRISVPYPSFLSVRCRGMS